MFCETESGKALAAEIAEVCGQINALYGRLVDLIAKAKEEGVTEGHGIRSTGHWVSWATGSSNRHGHALARLAERRHELPETVGALEAGELSIDQAAVIARRIPDWADAEMAEMGRQMTPAQLERAAGAYPRPGDGDGPPPERVNRREVRTLQPVEGAWQLRVDLPPDEGARVDATLSAHRDALFNEWRQSGADLASRPSMADAFLRMADRSLSEGAVDRPTQRRGRILVHLDLERGGAQHHLGGGVPSWVLHLLGCDASWQIQYERDGRPLGVGRARHIPDRLRVAVEHRDRGCRVPGCERRFVQLHHLHPHGEGGITETFNLICLCPHHHRLHHQGRLVIRGEDADDPNGITFANEHGTSVGGVSPPVPPDGRPPPDVAPYVHPSGERLQTKWITPSRDWLT